MGALVAATTVATLCAGSVGTVTGPTTLDDPERVSRSRLTESTDDATVLRVGRVTRFDAARIVVELSGSNALVDAAYLFGQYNPALGDIVVVLKSGASWVVLGTLSGNPSDNVVLNPSFEEGILGDVPTNWTLYHDPTSVATADVDGQPAIFGQELDGPTWLESRLTVPVGAGAYFSADYVLSAPIPVAEGQTWSASAYCLGFALSNPDGVESVAAVILTWYSRETDVYPNTVAPDTFTNSSTVPLTLPWIRLRAPGDSAGTPVPTGANFLRVGLFSILWVDRDEAVVGNEVRIMFDHVIGRRIT